MIASAPGADPDVIIRPGGRCTTPAGQEHSTTRGVGTWGAPGLDDPVMVNGLYTVETGAPARLLAALPPLAAIPAGQGSCPVNQAAFEDAARPAPGRQVLLDRMLDLILITALRSWFTRPGAQIPAWYRAHSDPVVGRALRLLDADLARPWTVETLAAKTGVSRAALARRFTALVGQPPMTYPREQRIAVAVAREVKAHAPHCRVIFTVYEMKRLGRDAAELTALAEHLTAHGLVLEMLAGPLPGMYDPSGPGRLLFAFFAAMAETERENIRESTLEGLDTAARKGKHGGRPPVITEDMLHTVLRRRAGGESVEQIQPDLLIPTGKRKGQSPSVASIYRALTEYEKRQAYPEAVTQAYADFAALTNGEAPEPRSGAGALTGER